LESKTKGTNNEANQLHYHRDCHRKRILPDGLRYGPGPARPSHVRPGNIDADKSGPKCSRTIGGRTPFDGGTTPIDGGRTPIDGGTTPIDGGTTPFDSGTTPFDGGTTHRRSEMKRTTIVKLRHHKG
jgi:hypothetical protein